MHWAHNNMHELYPAYYPPTPAQYDTLWRQGIIVLDTNVLLDLYRLPKKAQEELLSVLHAFKSQLWIPHQVGMEFQRNRATVVLAEQKNTDDTIKAICGALESAEQDFVRLEVKKRDAGVDAEAVENCLKSTASLVKQALEKVAANQLQLASEDPVRQQLGSILESRV